MSREKRRAGRGSARSRRTPVRAPGGGGLRIPWVPAAVVGGVIAVVALLAFLIWQQTQPAGESAAVKAEANASVDLPGEYVNLPEIYGDDSSDASYGGSPNTAPHVSREVDYPEEQGLPPAGGPHWGSGACPDDPDDAPPFCGPAPWGIYRTPWEPEILVHNMEHAGVVIWYNTIDEAIIDGLEDFARDNNDKNLVLTPFLEMEAGTIAITVWSRRDMFPVSDYSRDRLDNFIDKLYCKFDPEGFC